MALNYSALKTELTSATYNGLTDIQILPLLNAKTVSVTIALLILRGSQIYNSIVPTEFQALTAAQQQQVRDVFSLGDQVDVSANTNARAVLLAAFAAGSQTRANLVALASQIVAWYTTIGWPTTIALEDLPIARATA